MKLSRPWRLALLAAIPAGIGLCVHFSASVPDSSSERTVMPTPKPPQQSQENLTATGKQLSQKQEMPTGAEMAERGTKLAEIVEAEAFRKAFAAFQQDLSKDNWRQAMESVLPLLESGRLQGTVWDAFMTALGPFGKEEILRRFTPDRPFLEPEQASARFAVLGWAKADAAAVVSFLATFPEGKCRDSLCWGLFRAMGELPGLYVQVPESLWTSLASAEAANLTTAEARQAWLARIEATDGKKSPKYAAAKQAASLQELDELLARAATDVKPLVAFADQCFQNPADSSERVLRASLQAVSSISPEAAMLVIDRHAAKSTLLLANLPQVIESWSETDLGAPADWLNRSTASGIYDQAAAAYVEVLKVEDFKAAHRWAGTIKSAEIKEKTLQNLPPAPPL